MAKGYFLSAHRSEANLIKKAAYNLLAKVGEKLTVHENGVNQSTVLIESIHLMKP